MGSGWICLGCDLVHIHLLKRCTRHRYRSSPIAPRPWTRSCPTNRLDQRTYKVCRILDHLLCVNKLVDCWRRTQTEFRTTDIWSRPQRLDLRKQECDVDNGAPTSIHQGVLAKQGVEVKHRIGVGYPSDKISRPSRHLHLATDIHGSHETTWL